MTTDVINVPRELLDHLVRAYDHCITDELHWTDLDDYVDPIRTLLATAQPAADGERETFDAKD